MKTGIIVAMDRELRQLQQLFGHNADVCIAKCGIGKVNAALGAQRMISEFRPDAIISSGCAGGHGDDVMVQDVVVSSELCYHDVYCGTAIDNHTRYGQVQGMPARFQADPYLLSKALEMKRENGETEGDAAGEHFALRIHPGLIVTGDWFVDSRQKMRDIVALFPEARAVDMESAAIAQACYIDRVPFISFRIVSDVPLRDTDASQYHDFWSTLADRSFRVTKTFVESL